MAGMPFLYRLDAPARAIAEAFDADPGPDPWEAGYVAPTRFAPVIVSGRETRRIVPRQWGVPPPPRQALDGGRAVLTVRNPERPFWIGTLRHTEFRCLIPVTRFMEWGGAEGRRVRHWFALTNDPLFAFAGIWRDSEVPSFAIMTCEPNPLMESTGARSMPVILNAWDHHRWLRADWADVRGLIAPFPAAQMTEVQHGRLAD